MQRERERTKSTLKQNNGSISQMEYFPRKMLCQLIYKQVTEVKNLDKTLYIKILEKYDILNKVYKVIESLYKIIFSHKSELLENWISEALSLNLTEVDSFISGIQRDIDAVRNSINYDFNNGVAEGGINKLKLFK